ncbi:hypothetical protein C453_01295 [Haloferax elongans ATCC BAA-1513]|uniref:Uncharacterized protein n=1 Tax=Haloferax elongans ATCC BAA-1513 TaxID=1230453 RepID=M0I0D8_HALEO|nr:hypothetical protein [Haloferax elongans]ELZ88854.1 hypothetical protein C453_01295 [Haloferax elongans ATCC BAA-1513]
MTKWYDKLLEGPQTGIDLSNLNYEERMTVRQIDVQGTQGHAAKTSKGKFTRVTYIAGDEVAAARLFIEENRAILSEMDFSKKNRLQTSLDRSILDLILHELGERVATVFESVVVEERSDGTTWILSRDVYENTPDRRYSTRTGRAKVPAGVGLRELFESLPTGTIARQALNDERIHGDPTQLMTFFAEAFPSECTLVKSDTGTLSLVKTASSVTDEES